LLPLTLWANDNKKTTEGVSFTQTSNQMTITCSDGSALSVAICSGSVLKIWYAPTGRFVRNNTSFAVINDQLEKDVVLQAKEYAGYYEFYTSLLRVRINKNPLQVQVFDKYYQKLLFSDYKGQGHTHNGTRTAAYKVMRPDEHFFGLGEKTGKMDRRGSAYKMWNSDKPCYDTKEDPLYKSIPFFMSNYRYGIFFDNTHKTEFKFGTESDGYYSFEAPDGAMLYYFIFGKDYKEIIGQYVALTGQPIMPPKWAFGFSQCRGLLTNEALTREIAAGYRERRIPCDIIYQDIGWTNGLQTFDWQPDNYQNPKQMLDDLNRQGFKVIVSQDPVVSQETCTQWEEADRLGYFVKDSATGKTYDMPWPWGGNCGVVDFTVPEVADWWGVYQQKPLDDGVRGFWTDMGEPAWSNEEAPERLNMQHYAGMHSEIHNVYGLTWDKVVKEQFEKRNPNQRIFQMTRSAYAGLQRYTFGWTGDSGNADDLLQGWKQLANQIPVILSAGLGIIPFITTDITGYCGDITDYPAASELFVRWLQFGIFNPLSRLHHEGNNAVEPWLFGEQAEKIAKKVIEFKYRHLPYIYTYAREAHDKGLPVMRPTFLEYPADDETFTADEQFMFGKELLIAPVVKKGAMTKQVYFPEGTWIDYNDKKTTYTGEEWHTVEAPLERTPVFVKSGSIIPTMPVVQYVNERRVYPIIFDIFPAAIGTATFELYEDEGEDLGYLSDAFAKTPVHFKSTGKEHELTVEPRKGQGYEAPSPRNLVFRVFMKTAPEKVTIQGKNSKKVSPARMEESIEKDTQSVLWSWNKQQGTCLVKLPDTGNGYTVLIR
jgi:alpha-glucosidase